MSPVLSGQENSARKSRRLLPITSIRRLMADGVRDLLPGGWRRSMHLSVLLLHGFPTSSFMFRELIPRLADAVPGDCAGPAWFWIHGSARRTKLHIFVRRAGTHDRNPSPKLLGLGHYAIYIFDYGAPYRLASRDAPSGTSDSDRLAEWQRL